MKNHLKDLWMLIIGSLIYVIGINYFIVTANIFSAGLMGLSQEFAQTVNLLFDFHWTNISSEYLLVQTLAYWTLNLPAIILGFWKVGGKFTGKTLFCSFVLIPLFMNLLIPNGSIILDNGQITLTTQILSAIVGGILTGIGMGIIFKHGASSGGTDIVATYLALFKGKSFGAYNLLINMVVIIWAVILYNDINVGILLLILIFVQSKAVDYIYNFNEKVTLLVITLKEFEISRAILETPNRTFTKIDAVTGYSKDQAALLLLVVNREEVNLASITFKNIDENCFIDVLSTDSIVGNFENRFKSRL